MLLRIWRNLDTHNCAYLRILNEPNVEWTEPTLKNTALDIELAIIYNLRHKVVYTNTLKQTVIYEQPLALTPIFRK